MICSFWESCRSQISCRPKRREQKSVFFPSSLHNDGGTISQLSSDAALLTALSMTSSYLEAGCGTDLQMASDITAYPLSPLWSMRWEEPTSKMIIQAEFKWHVCGGKCAERSARRASYLAAAAWVHLAPTLLLPAASLFSPVLKRRPIRHSVLQ